MSGGSLSRGVSVQGVSVRETPRMVKSVLRYQYDSYLLTAFISALFQIQCLEFYSTYQSALSL